jgi:hypothetical protein
MPTISEPKTSEEPKTQVESPSRAEPELFAAEIAMEEKSYNFAPWLLATALACVLGSLVYYFVKSGSEVLSPVQATATLSDVLRTQGPAVVSFGTGTVVPANGQKDALYKLLAKAGVVETKPKDHDSLVVDITGPGDNVLSNISGVEKVKRNTGGTNYTVPLAERKLVSIDKVTLLRPHVAKVDYTWQWVPNRLGREFDATSELVQSFPTWDRSILIKSDGVDFYSAAPAKASMVLTKSSDGTWKPYRE